MKFNLNVLLKRTYTLIDNSEKFGFDLKINNYYFSFRPRYNYEDEKLNTNASEKTKEILNWEENYKKLYKKTFLKLPFNYCLKTVKTLSTPAKELGLKDINVDWIIDEFDSSFNDLAIASMKYNMDWSLTSCSQEQRKIYEDLIKRLTFPIHEFTEEEVKQLENHYQTDDFNHSSSCESCSKIFDSSRKRKDEYYKNLNKARKDFVDIIPTLWS